MCNLPPLRRVAVGHEVVEIWEFPGESLGGYRLAVWNEQCQCQGDQGAMVKSCCLLPAAKPIIVYGRTSPLEGMNASDFCRPETQNLGPYILNPKQT